MSASPGVVGLVRRRFFAGLAILVPIILTAKALGWLLSFLDDLADPLAQTLFGRTLSGLGVLLTLSVVLLTGVLFSIGPFKRLLSGLEDLVEFVPLVGTMYGTTKKVLTGFAPDSQGFKRFVFARLGGRTTPGFLTGNFTLEGPDGGEQALCTVYVPTNHLYLGDIVVLPREDVLETDLSLEDGIGLVLSGGASVPVRVKLPAVAGRRSNPG